MNMQNRKMGQENRSLAPTEIQPAGIIDKILFRIVGGIIAKFFKVGNVELTFLDCAAIPLGDGKGEAFTVRFHRKSALLRILYKPALYVGEVFMDGGWELEQGDIGRFMGLLLKNEEILEETFFFKVFDSVASTIGHWLNVNNVDKSHANVQHHYDLGNDLYKSFLDENMLYSCAFFDEGIKTLSEAQKNKLATTIDRLKLEPGMEVLEIGCGWGAMSYAIADRGGKATGITLSSEQLELAKSRLHEYEDESLRFILQDYRVHAKENAGKYDRVVSIGMFEHVGRRHYQEYFEAIRDVLKPGGRAVIHSIVKDTTTLTNPWIRKYIFPGGQVPRILDMVESAKSVGLTIPVTPYEHTGFHYAETLRHWRQRFEEAWPTLDHSRYDERFRRMWLFYLGGSEASFEALNNRVAQVVVEKPSS